jgi:hypothetical protein
MTRDPIATRLNESLLRKMLAYCAASRRIRLLEPLAREGNCFANAWRSKRTSALISRSSIWTSSWSSGRLRRFARVFKASSSRSLFISHRGENGMNQIPIARMMAGTPWMMRGIRHAHSDCPSRSPLIELVPYAIQYASKIPTVVVSCWRATRKPRTSGGASSAL